MPPAARQTSVTIPRTRLPLALEHLQSRMEPPFTYLYYPVIDEIAHAYGCSHDLVATALKQTDSILERLFECLGDNVRLIVTSDHGHVEIPVERRFRPCQGRPVVP